MTRALEDEDWRQIVADLGSVNAQIADITLHVADASVANLSLIPLTDEHAYPFVVDTMTSTMNAMRGLLAAQANLQGILTLIGVRLGAR